MPFKGCGKGLEGMFGIDRELIVSVSNDSFVRIIGVERSVDSDPSTPEEYA